MKRTGFVQPSGIDRRANINRKLPEAKPRDDLDQAFAGSENKGPAGNQKGTTTKSTNVKSRKLNNVT